MHRLLSKLWERRAKLAKSDKGFTLIELLVVVVILGVLIAIAIPLYLNYRKGANDAAAQSDLRNALSTEELCLTDTNAYGAFAATTAPTVVSPCSTQKINLSSGTTMTATAVTATSAVSASYVVYDTNANGSGKWFCYDSKVGGSVKSTTTAYVAPVTSC